MTATLTLPRGTADAVVDQLFPEESGYLRDPEGWLGERLRERFWSAQQQIARSVIDHRYTAVKSAHDTGKSYEASRLAAWWLDVHPIGEAFVVTTAPTQPQVDAILWREIRSAHRKGSLHGRVTLDSKWYMGADELVAFGRKPADYSDAERARAAFQGIHARYVLVIIDEASGIPRWLFEAVDSLATNEHARVLAIGNPDDPVSQFAEVCKPGSGWNVITISAFDTPAFTGEEVAPSLLELLVSRTWVEERAKRWGEDSALYQSKVLARFPDVSDDTIFPPRLINQAWAADLPGLDHGGYGGDVARYGDSETVVYRNRGGVIRLVAAARKQVTTATTGLFARVLGVHRADHMPMYVDADGVGAGVYDQLRAQGLAALEFRGGMAARDSERFVNRRAEMFWLLREGMEAGEVDLDPADDVLAAQLGRLKWKLDGRGRIQVESKEDMARRGVKSPDRADAAAMAYVAPSRGFTTEEPKDEEPSLSLTGDLLTRTM